MADYGENLCQAVDEIVSSRLEKLSFDITEEATVVEDLLATSGIYQVNNGDMTYQAYSNDMTLQQGDVVLVTIPKNDYSQHKTIIGKKDQYKDNEDMKTYHDPFESYVSVTKNLVINGPLYENLKPENSSNEIELKNKEIHDTPSTNPQGKIILPPARMNPYTSTENISVFSIAPTTEEEKQKAEAEGKEIGDDSFKEAHAKVNQPVWKQIKNNENHAFSRMGIKASFLSSLNSSLGNKGEYALEVSLRGYSADADSVASYKIISVSTDSQDKDILIYHYKINEDDVIEKTIRSDDIRFIRVDTYSGEQRVQIFNNEQSVRVVMAELSSKDIIGGDPYKLTYPVQQSALFELPKNLLKITEVGCYLKAKNFPSISNQEKVNTDWEDSTSEAAGLEHNFVEVSNIEITFGYDKSELFQDKLSVFSMEDLSYYTDTKNIERHLQALWYQAHKDGSITLFDANSDLSILKYWPETKIEKEPKADKEITSPPKRIFLDKTITDSTLDIFWDSKLKGFFWAVKDEDGKRYYNGIKWYTQSMGSPTPDRYCGPHWIQYNCLTEEQEKLECIEYDNIFKCLYKIDPTQTSSIIKAVIITDAYSKLTTIDSEHASVEFSIHGGYPLSSNEITFTNENYYLTQEELQDSLSKLQIVGDDKYNFKYFIYNLNNTVADKALVAQKHNLSLELEKKPINSINQDYSNCRIEWEVPVKDSMIKIDFEDIRTTVNNMKNIFIEGHEAYEHYHWMFFDQKNNLIYEDSWSNITDEPWNLPECYSCKIIQDFTKQPRLINEQNVYFPISYYIHNIYEATRKNNVITCNLKNMLNHKDYRTAISVQFGQNYTSGTNYIFYLECEKVFARKGENNQIETSEKIHSTNITMNAGLKQIFTITPHLYSRKDYLSSKEPKDLFADNSEGIKDIDYYFVKPIATGLEQSQNDKENIDYFNEKLAVNIKTAINNNKSLTFEIIPQNITDNFYTVIRAETHWGNTNIITYLPLSYSYPLEATEYPITADGVFDVYYDSASGKPFDVLPIAYDLNYNKSDENISSILNAHGYSYKWQIMAPLKQENKAYKYMPVPSDSALYYPQIDLKDNTLIPNPFFINNSTNNKLNITDLNTSQLLIQCFVEDYQKQSILLWSQPLMLMRNEYSNSIINDWQGIYPTTDNKNNTILSAMIGAGTKKDNKFSGVLMGKVQGDAENSLGLHGLYGFSDGVQSFAFTENGKAFLGKEGAGRIEFDGEKSTIESATYKFGQGMQIDLNDSYFEMRSTIINHSFNFDDAIKATNAGSYQEGVYYVRNIIKGLYFVSRYNALKQEIANNQNPIENLNGEYEDVLTFEQDIKYLYWYLFGKIPTEKTETGEKVLDIDTIVMRIRENNIYQSLLTSYAQLLARYDNFRLYIKERNACYPHGIILASKTTKNDTQYIFNPSDMHGSIINWIDNENAKNRTFYYKINNTEYFSLKTLWNNINDRIRYCESLNTMASHLQKSFNSKIQTIYSYTSDYIAKIPVWRPQNNIYSEMASISYITERSFFDEYYLSIDYAILINGNYNNSNHLVDFKNNLNATERNESTVNEEAKDIQPSNPYAFSVGYVDNPQFSIDWEGNTAIKGKFEVKNDYTEETILKVNNEGASFSNFDLDMSVEDEGQYQFGRKGLTIKGADIDADTKTVINHTGLVVQDQTIEQNKVLEVTSNGAMAQNLRTNTYLQIGGGSRLETFLERNSLLHITQNDNNIPVKTRVQKNHLRTGCYSIELKEE